MIAQARRTHVIRHQSQHGEWEAAFGDPDPRLAGLVRGYLGYVENTTRFERRREIPTGDVALIIPFGHSEVRVVDRQDTTLSTAYRDSVIAGPVRCRPSISKGELYVSEHPGRHRERHSLPTLR